MAKRGKSKKDKKKEKDETVGGESQVAEELQGEDASETTETPAEDAPVEETPAEDVPVEETPAEETPAAETPVEETPVAETPAEETPVAETPVAETPAEETPVEETPAAETPVAETPAEETPVAEISAEDAPVAEISAEDSPVAEAPVAETPVSEEAEVLEPEEVEELWICSKCNRENRGKSRFCSGCGESKVKEEGPVDEQGKPRVVYADLIIYDSKGNSKRVSLLNERITIGRVDPLAQIYPDIDLTFFDSEQIVSRRHCEIFQKPPGQYFLVDIGSSNGTFLNRKKIQKGVSLLLNDNDEVHFAKTRTIFSQSLD